MSTPRPAVSWAMLLGLTILWGSAFAFTKVAVSALPAPLVAGGRLAVAASILLPLAVLLGRPWPGGRGLWLFLGLIALFGNALPFSLISWGQGFIASGLAGILMAVMPIMTLGLAHFFVPGERLTPSRVGGFLLGFSGVVVLMGPEAVTGLRRAESALLPMLAVLGGAASYAIAAILARRRPASDAVSSAAATTSIAALLLLPLAVTAGGTPAPVPVTAGHWAAVLVLGVFSTALATVLYFRLIRCAGPSFVSQINYLIPLWAVLMGILFLGEAPEARHLYALALILGGLLLTHATLARAGYRKPGALPMGRVP